jgi:hypothetical protein
LSSTEDGLLDRARSLKQAHEPITLAQPTLVEAVDFGADLFGRLLAAQRQDEVKDQRLALVFPYLILIEMLDGVEILLSSASPIVARLSLRTAFEALLTIDYILETDTQRRALAWVVCDVHRRIDVYEMLDPNTPKGKEYEKVRSVDVLVGQMPPLNVNSSLPVKRLRRMLSYPHLVEAEKEFQTRRAVRRNSPSWYSFYGGPSHLRQLAEHLKLGGYFNVLYRVWSGTAHAQDLYRQLTHSPDRKFAVRVLRDPSELSVAATHGLSFFIEATRKLIGYYLPAEMPAWQEWYKTRISERYTRLARGPKQSQLQHIPLM